MSEFGSIQTALSGMTAQRRALDTIGHNVANANTDGYSRQQVSMQAIAGGVVPAVWSKPRFGGQGAEVTSVTRVRDQFFDTRYRAEVAKAGFVSTQSAVLDRVEMALPEPSDTGLAEQLGQFWSSWSDVADQPQQLPARSALLEQAATLTTSLHRAASDLTAARDDYVVQLKATVDQANSLAGRIAGLNDAVRGATASGLDANDLADQRDVLADQLTRLVGGTVNQLDDGSINIFVGSVAYVRGAQYATLSVAEGPASTSPAVGFAQVSLSWSGGIGPADVTDGEVGGMLGGVNGTLPRYLDQLNGVASKLVSTVNAAHAGGYDLSGTTTGLDFFDPVGVTAATIAVSGDVAGKPQLVAAGAPSGVAGTGTFDGSVAKAIAGLSSRPDGADASYRSLIGTLGVEAAAVQRRDAMQQNVLTQVDGARQSESGVNLDEELANLVQTQHAYSAAARVLTAIDETLEILLSRTGRVGL
jgi:flagellar hook-associated protein 1 FlgK